MMPNTGSCWEQRGLLSSHGRTSVSRTHLGPDASKPACPGAPRPSTAGREDAGVSLRQILTQCCDQISFALLDLAVVFAASESPTKGICENGARK